jgi:hypothetical protein
MLPPPDGEVARFPGKYTSGNVACLIVVKRTVAQGHLSWRQQQQQQQQKKNSCTDCHDNAGHHLE